MADGDGGVAHGRFLDQQVGDGLADDVAAADDDDLGAVELDAAADQELEDAVGRAGQIGLLPDDHAADIDGMEAIDILGRIDGQQDFVFVDMLGQRELHEDAVDAGVFVEAVDQGQQFGLGCGGREAIVRGVHADLLAGLFLGGDIGGAGRIASDQDHRQTGRDAAGLEFGDLLFEFPADAFGDRFPVNHLCGHGDSTPRVFSEKTFPLIHSIRRIRQIDTAAFQRR